MMYRGGYERSAPYYDLFDDKKNIDFFHHYAKKAGEILDIGAGTGRIAIPIAKRGIKVYCIEPSPAMLAQFNQKLKKDAKLKENIVLINDQAAGFKLDKSFPAAFMSGTFDHFLNDRERTGALHNIRKHLKPEGKLIFDVYLGLMKDSGLHAAGKVIRANREYRRFIKNTVKQRNLLEVTLIYETYEHGNMVCRVEEKSRAGIINRDHIHEILNKTGFAVNKEYSNFNFNSYRQGDKLLILEVVKKE